MLRPVTAIGVRPRTATIGFRTQRPILPAVPSVQLVTTPVTPVIPAIADDLGGSLPGLQLVSRGKGIDINESTQIQNAIVTAVQQGATPLSRECAEGIKRRLGGEWFVFVSVVGQEDFNFSLTRCKGSDYMVLTYAGRKFQINRLRDYSPPVVPVVPVQPVQPVVPVQTIVETLPPITLPTIYAEATEVNMPTPTVAMPAPQMMVTNCNFKLISVGQGIDSNEAAHIKNVCINAYQRGARPLSRFCADGIKAGVGGDWFVFISDEMQEDYNFSLTRCKGSDFMVFVIDNIKFQVCRLRGLS